MEIPESEIEAQMKKFEMIYKGKCEKWKIVNECFFNPFHEKFDLYKRDPLDAIKAFKKLMRSLKTEFPTEYGDIHKGIPFFVIGASSFILKNYNQAIFYLDAAVAEDRKNQPDSFLDSWAPKFFLMESEPYQGLYEHGEILISELKTCVRRELDRFNNETHNKLIFEDFKKRFVEKILLEGKNTAILTTLYSFICEKDDVMEMIYLRGEHGGSTEPMITHLLKGSLLFETLLKYILENIDNRKYKKLKTLGQIIPEYYCKDFFSEYECRNEEMKELSNIIDYIKDFNFDFQIKALCVTSKIRNLSAHDLNLKDEFTGKEYEGIYHQILNAIFYIIKKEYL